MSFKKTEWLFNSVTTSDIQRINFGNRLVGSNSTHAYELDLSVHDSDLVLTTGSTMTGDLVMSAANIVLDDGATVDGRDVSLDATTIDAINAAGTGILTRASNTSFTA